MKKNILIWVAAISLMVIAFFVINNNQLSGNSSIQASSNAITKSTNTDDNSNLIAVNSRQNAIDFTLTDLDGNKVRLSDFKGKNVYLNFFATWCPPKTRDGSMSW